MMLWCTIKGITMGVRRVHFPLARSREFGALERLVVIKFPRVNLDFFICMYLHTKSTYFHIAVSSRIRFHFLIAGYQSCSTHGAPQHLSIPHHEIPLRFRERGILIWGIDECCGAWREEHGDIWLLANGKELVKRWQY